MSRIEQLTPELTREYLLDGCIIAFQLNNMDWRTTDAWYEANKAALEKWPADRPILMLQDIAIHEAMPSSYFRTRSSELVKMRPDVHGRNAVVIHRSLTTQALRGLFIIVNRASGLRQRRLFFSREDAIRWLEEAL